MSSVIGGLSCGNDSGGSGIEVVIEVATVVAVGVAVVGEEVKLFDNDREIRVMGSHTISLIAIITKKRE